MPVMARTYTPEQRVEALAALELNGGALRFTAAAVNVPAPTLLRWRDEAERVPEIAERKEDPAWAGLWAATMEAALAELHRKMPGMGGKDLAIAAGIAADKHQDYWLGRKGTAINIDARQQTIRLGPDTPDEVLAYLAQQAGVQIEGPEIGRAH